MRLAPLVILTLLGSAVLSPLATAGATRPLADEARILGTAVADVHSYSIEPRQLPPPPVTPSPDDTTPTPDGLENNWSPATAAPIGVGVIYDLSFVCPVPGGCPGGDHDYLLVPVKAGVAYLIATFDLGPGVDTVLDLFWGDGPEPVASNDDLHPGAAFLSLIRWTAPADGLLTLRVGPRTGGLTPLVADDQAGTYRLAVALAASELAQQLEDRIADQALLPTATPAAPVPAAPPAAPAPAPPAAAAPMAPTAALSTDAPTGTAVVQADTTALRESPSATAPEITSLPADTVVTLLGQASGSWVRVQPIDGLLPGWVRGADLALQPPPSSSPTTASPTTTSTVATSGGGSPPPGSSPPATATPEAPRVERLAPLPPPLPTPPALLLPLALDVRVVAVTELPAGRSGQPIPTPQPSDTRPLAAIRVQLVDALGDVRAEALTNADGAVRLSSSLPAGLALYIQLPAAGLRIPLAPDRAALLILLPTPDGGSR